MPVRLCLVVSLRCTSHFVNILERDKCTKSWIVVAKCAQFFSKPRLLCKKGTTSKEGKWSEWEWLIDDISKQKVINYLKLIKLFSRRSVAGSCLCLWSKDTKKSEGLVDSCKFSLAINGITGYSISPSFKNPHITCKQSIFIAAFKHVWVGYFYTISFSPKVCSVYQ